MKFCIYCGSVILPSKSSFQNFHDECSRNRDRPFGMPYIKQTVFVQGYGDVSKARIDAVDSQIMLQDDPKDGKHDYLTGTKLSNGKIKDVPIDLRP